MPLAASGASDSFWISYTLSCAAATIAETATYPLDLTKTRLQIQGEHVQLAKSFEKNVASVSFAQAQKGMLRTAYEIVKEEGVLKLWQGVTPAVVRHYVYTGARIGVYEHLRAHIFRRNTDGTFPVWKSICSGMLGGAVAQLLASPTDLIKVQMQMEGRRKLEGLPPRFRSMWHAFRSVLAENGIRGLWKGWIPNCQRAALVNMADLATYDKVKHELLRQTSMEDNYVLHAMSSACSGLSAAVVSIRRQTWSKQEL